MGSYVDMNHLASLVRAKRGRRGLRDVAREIGDVSPSTLSRVENGKLPDMETFLLICDWLSIPPATVIKTPDDRSTMPVSGDAESIVVQLRASKDLDPEVASAIATMVIAARRATGKTSPDDERPPQ